ncbi:hypothetical protein SDC9_156782 [bioreactor metagenome]|uniref:Uncharacterized protein n=1 Tax=bioreactor metagenome TaxID=1076179 RepID=A0A645F7I8_9ZZZZ
MASPYAYALGADTHSLMEYGRSLAEAGSGNYEDDGRGDEQPWNDTPGHSAKRPLRAPEILG